MSKALPSKNANQSLEPRRKPRQQRAIERERLILRTAAELLDRVGVESLNTVLIAEEVGISVGSLYQYFPNKHAILYTLGKRWLDEAKQRLDEMDSWPLAELGIETFVDRQIDLVYRTYREQKGLLPLVQAIASIPELRELEAEHDQLVISRSALVFKQLGLAGDKRELSRIADVYLSMVHALMLVAVAQKGKQVDRTLTDAKSAILNLLRDHEVTKG